MSIYDKLNQQQREAVESINGPLLILAGAGSGKTSVLTHRIAYMIDEYQVNPYNILAITFTNKAAGEMRERVDKLVGFGSDQIFVSTFHSMCVRILRRFIDVLGYDNNFTIYDSDDQKQLVREACKKLQIDTKQLKERTIMNYISGAKDELITPEEFMTRNLGDYNMKKVASVYMEYQSMLRKNNALDFDDLIMKTVELFKVSPEALNTYHNRWKYIMVDEYQDTNKAQFELVRLLASDSRNLCVVGDDDQSIYKFRGADITNILNFEHYYPDAKVIKLEKNYRSMQNILTAANSVIRNNSSRKDKALWTDKGEGERIHFRQFDTAIEETEFISDTIAKSIRQGKSTYGENAILYRTNAQSRLMEERLVKDNIPYKIVGGVNFYARREIKDLLAYLKTIDNGRDDVACKRIINVPKRGIGATSINKLQDAADARDTSFFNAICHPEWTDVKGAAADKLHSFESMILRLRAVAEVEGPAKALREILDVTDYINQMEVDSEEEAEERIGNIEEFLSKVVSYEENNEDATLSGLLEEIALVAEIDNVNAGDDITLLMTIHSAKGLEFKNVYLIGMEDGLFPSYMSISGGDMEIEEERRLAYVAITRAKESLYITSARARMVNGQTQYNPVSRFVNEIPRELFDIAPMVKRYRDNEYRDFDTSDGGGYRKYDSFRDDEGSGFSGFKRESSGSRSSYGGSSYGGSSSYGEGFSGFKRESSVAANTNPYTTYARPKAIVTPKATAEEDKPFIARASSGAASLAGLTKGSDIQNSAAKTGDIQKGDRVRHIKFGDGTVVNIVKEPRDSKVTVAFDTCGQKIMYASFAKLQKI